MRSPGGTAEGPRPPPSLRHYGSCRGPGTQRFQRWAILKRPSGTNTGYQQPDYVSGGDAVDDALLAGFPVVVELPVNWGEMDAYRHVNNVVYFRYFENARLEYFRRLDWFAYEQQTGVGPILAATRATFRKPL